jgi:hypothetical protein
MRGRSDLGAAPRLAGAAGGLVTLWWRGGVGGGSEVGPWEGRESSEGKRKGEREWDRARRPGVVKKV